MGNNKSDIDIKEEGVIYKTGINIEDINRRRLNYLTQWSINQKIILSISDKVSGDTADTERNYDIIYYMYTDNFKGIYSKAKLKYYNTFYSYMIISIPNEFLQDDTNLYIKFPGTDYANVKVKIPIHSASMPENYINLNIFERNIALDLPPASENGTRKFLGINYISKDNKHIMTIDRKIFNVKEVQ